MAFDAAAVKSLFDHAQSALLKLGVFETVNTHEPLSAPGNGVRAAMWVDSITPQGRASGLAATSGVVTLLVRCYANALQPEQDAIDPNMLTATTTVLGAFSGSFTLGGTVRNIDLLGSYGRALGAQAGYQTQDSKLFRIMTITLPVVVDDLWTQEA